MGRAGQSVAEGVGLYLCMHCLHLQLQRVAKSVS